MRRVADLRDCRAPAFMAENAMDIINLMVDFLPEFLTLLKLRRTLRLEAVQLVPAIL